MRARRYFQRTGNAEVLGTKKLGQRIKIAQERLNVEDTSFKAMVAIDGASFDWSYMADDESTINMALMALSHSEEFQHPEFKGYGPKASKSVYVNTSNEIKKAPDALIIEDWVSDSDEDESKVMVLKSDNVKHKHDQANQPRKGDPQDALKDQGYFDSGCTKHMTGNISNLTDFKEHDGGYVAFGGGGAKGAKNKTSRILKKFISEIENLVDKKVKIIKCDNGTKFKNSVMNEFCEEKCIKREFNVARTPQQNKVDEKRNKTLIKAARTMLADSKLPTRFYAEAVNTTCYVQNRVLVVKPHFKTPYELFRGRSHALSFMRPFECHVTILNTLDQLEKFDGKLDEGIFVGYSTISKAFRVYNTRTRKVEENLHITFLENKPMITGGRPKWLFDIDAPLKSINYAPVPVESECDNQERPNAESSPKNVNTDGPSINTANANDNTDNLNINTDTGIFDDAYDDRDKGAKADYNNLVTVISVSPIPSPHIHKDHPKEQVIGEMEPKKGHRQEEGIDYDEVFALVARIEAIRLFLAYASFMDFTVYQIDVKSAFLYGTIKEEVYVSQPSGIVDLEFPDRVYKVGKALYGLHQALRACIKSANSPMETHKPLSKDANGRDVDVHLYKCMIGSLMYLTSSRLDIMFVVCACSRFQVQPKVSHIHAVKRIFRYLKGQPTLGLWYPKDLPLEL
nr:retrovirus-related Pol polyprotein from transposon TNT 1-94 [Tanacetum cinerariifolium]